PDYNGPVPSATYTVSDANGGIDTAVLSFNDITPTADISDDNITIDENTSAPLDVLINDNFEGSPQITAFTQGANGSVSLNADGTGIYTPNAHYFGTDSFTYTVTSGGVTETATVTIVVTEKNAAPEANEIPNQNAVDGQPVSIDFSNYFSDPNTDTLTYSITGLPAGLTLNTNTGTLSGTIDNSASQDGPINDGIYTITVTANDGRGGTVDQSFTYTIVNALPTAVNDTASTSENTGINIDVLINDSDPDNDTLIITEAIAGNGTVVINADNTVTYTPNINFNGTDTIIYRIVDGEGGESTASVDVTITPINDDPTTSGIDDQADADGSTINLDISPNFTDIDGDVLNFTASGLPLGLSVDPVTGIISGTVAGNISTFEPYNVTITADDGNGGTVLTSFTWAFENIPPIANDDIAMTAEDSAVVISVLTNDTDPDNDSLIITEASASHGSVIINSDNTITYTPDTDFNGTDIINYRITDGQDGYSTATVTVTVTPVNDTPIVNSALPNETSIDGQSVSINFAPFFSDIDNDTLSFSATGLPNGISIDAVSGVISGSFDSNASSSSPYTITITADDNNGESVSESFTWSVDNPPLQANPDSNTVNENENISIDAANGVLFNDQDPDGDSLLVAEVNNSITNVGQPVNGSSGGTFTVNADGSYSFDAGNDFDDLADTQTRTTSIVYQASDGEGGLSSATLTITVIGTNSSPESIPENKTTNEDTPVSGQVIASDAEGDILTFTVDIDPINGSVSINTDGTYLYTPNEHFNGTDTFTVKIDDGNGGTSTQTITITVDSVNDAPIAANDGPFTVTEDTPVNGNVLTNDSDLEGDTLSVVQFVVDGSATVYSAGDTATITGVGELIINADGTFTFTPAADYNGPVPSATYTLSDANGGFDTAIVSFNDIIAVNDAPSTVDNGPILVTEGTPASGNVLTNDSDVDGDTLTVTQFVMDGDTTVYNAGDTAIIAGVGELIINADGTFTFTPAADYNGPVPSATYTASDASGSTNTATLNFNDVSP
ncbi:Ig-like domain-containing protein, partial [Pseudoalteromonas sp. Z9A5]|uniref:Ig-like domain-containing protein n=1 Tax=Pseudoalteromonas sp. Z9A5 TaxID=2686355 RepID=UPI00197ECF49